VREVRQLHWPVRVALAFVLLWDVPTLVYASILLSRGGTQAVHIWVIHVALMGRLFDTVFAEHQRLIVQAYVVFASMIVVAPAALYASTMACVQARGKTGSVISGLSGCGRQAMLAFSSA